MAADIATSTLNDLLMFDKIETGMLEINTAECSMHEFITSCVKPFTLLASSDKITLTNTFTDARTKISSRDEYDIERGQAIQRGVMVKIDKYKMQQVVRNFLTNALKFTHEGGRVAVNVTLKDGSPSNLKDNIYSSNSPPIVRVEVVDNGPGISAENLPKLFGQYVQFDANKLQEGRGSGLGLWLSKSIVELHGGVIGANSDGHGKGSCFYFELAVSQLCEEDYSLDCSSHRYHQVAVNRRKSYEIKVLTRTSSDDPPSPHMKPRLASDLFTVTENFLEPEGEEPMADTRPSSTRDPAPPSASPLISISERAKRYEILLSHEPNANEGGVERSFKASSPSSAKVVSPKMRISVNDIRVLLVDDSAIARKMVERTLFAIEGCVCSHAVHGQNAVQMVAESILTDATPYDVILMDHYMPVMNGPEAVNLIRGQGYRGVILAVTGASSDSEFNALLGQGVDRILVKPFNLDEFKRAYREVKRRNILADAADEMV
jgi:CheY-like chemotaxis protein